MFGVGREGEGEEEEEGIREGRWERESKVG